MAKKPEFKTLEELEKYWLSELGDTSFYLGAEQKEKTRIPIGHSSLDETLGGGIPKGKITEIFGPPSSCKSLLLYNALGQAQKQGDVAVLIDAEKAFDPYWASKNNVNTETLRVIEPNSGEEAYEIILDFLQMEEVGIIGVDSIAQLVPRAEIEGEMADANIGLAARLNAKAMRKITKELDNTALVLINQTRKNVSTGPFIGNPNTTPGGTAIPFYASLRLNVRRIGWVRSGEEKTGGIFRCRVDKCKVTGIRPMATSHFEVDFTSGLDIAKDVLLKAQAKGWIEKRGAWYIFDNETKLQGEAAAKQYILDNNLINIWTNNDN